MTNEQLYNCCTNNEAPDWSKFTGLAIVAMADFDGRSEVAEPGCDINFWCVFGVNTDGMYEPITDCTSRAMASVCAAALGKLSGLSLQNDV